MSKKKLLVGVLAGTMLVASIGVQASSISKDVYKLDKLSTTSVSQEALPRTSNHEHDEDKPTTMAVPVASIAKQDAIAVPLTSIMKPVTTATMVTSIASEGDVLEAENTVSFSELTEEVKKKLTKVYGDVVTEMVFPSIEYAEKLADRDLSKVTSSKAIPATPMTPASTK